MGYFTCLFVFVELGKLISKLYKEGKVPRRAKTLLKSSNVGEIALPDMRIYYKTVLIEKQ